MKFLFFRHFSGISHLVGRSNLPLFSFSNIFPLCSITIRYDHSPPASPAFQKPCRPFYLLLLEASVSYSIILSVQNHAYKSGFQHDRIICTALLNSLAKVGESSSARKLFDEMPIKDVAAWNAMLSGYVRGGLLLMALSFYQLMRSFCINPNSITLSVLLQLCVHFDDQIVGRSIHAFAYRHHVLNDTFLANSLIVYYNKFDDFKVSERVFENLPIRDIVSWNAMISGYMISCFPWKSLELFWVMRKEFLHQDLITFEIALQACSRIGKDAFFDGMLIHSILIRLGVKMDLYTENCLLLMYCKCGMLASGQSLFDAMETRNVVSWTIMVNAYVHINCPLKAFDLFLHARLLDAELSSNLMASALQAVRLMGEQQELVMSLHGLIIIMGFHSDIYINCSVISAYGDSGEIEMARSYFNHILSVENHCTVLWNSMLSVYLRHGHFYEAMKLIGNQFVYDAASIVNILSLCISKLGLMAGKAVHGHAFRKQFESDVFVSTSLLELYITYGVFQAACRIFSVMPCRNIVSWNTMIIGCARLGIPCASLKLFCKMQQRDGIQPDATSVVGAVEAILSRGIQNERKFIHDYATEKGFINDEFVASSLISMHSRYHDLNKAGMVFDSASKLGIVVWNTMIAEYSYHGLIDRAMATFIRMKNDGLSPDSITALCLLQGCITSASLHGIAVFHSIICKSGYDCDVYVGSALINAYSKCGNLSMARQVFDAMASTTVVSWNSMINGYGIHGDVRQASKLFLRMRDSGLHPSAVTFLVLISACSHGGYVENGLRYLDHMIKAFSVSPQDKHLSSFVDLLGREGMVEEANELLEKITEGDGVFAWGALLGACRVQDNLELALTAAQKLFAVKPWHQGYRTLLSNVLGESGRWVEASLVRVKADEGGLRKEKACSIVETLS